MAVIRIGDSPRRGAGIASSQDPRLQIGAYITDGIRLLKALCELDKEGRWAYEDCMHAREVVKLTAREVGACTLIAPAEEQPPVTDPAPETLGQRPASPLLDKQWPRAADRGHRDSRG